VADESVEENRNKWFAHKYWVSPYNWLKEVRSQFDLPRKIYVHDVTLREADQHPGIALRGDEKLKIAIALDELGVGSVEIAPLISSEDENATKQIAKQGLKAKVIAFSSWRKEDVDQALKCDVDGVILDYVGNPWQAKTFWNLKPEEQIRRGVEAISYAKSHGLFVIALPWDDYRAPMDFLEKNYKACANEGKADHVTLTETFGFSLPWTTVLMTKKIKSWIPKTPIEKHGHNDFGLATADMVAAVAGGAEVVQTTMCGIGERAGNASTEEAAVAIELLLGVPTGIHLDRIYDTARLVQDLTKYRIAENKPIIGGNIFTTSSGWLAFMKGKAKEIGMPQGLVPFLPELIGAPPERFVIGKGSGRSLVASKLKQNRVNASEGEIDEITEIAKQECIIRKGTISDEQLVKIAKRVVKPSRASGVHR